MRKPLAIAINAAICASSALWLSATHAQTSSESLNDGSIEEVTIIGIRDDRKSQGATGLDLSIWETPQSLTIIDSATIDTFGLTDINSLLKLTTGVNVNSSETDRTSYNSRGFDITSMHIDGVGMPFGTIVVGDIDTAIYEKVEVIRGSNGLITGLGNPSGTINYVRKRPINEFEGDVKLTRGTWDNTRAEVDVSTPLNASGTWAVRAVAAVQDKDSWLDRYNNQRQTAYIVVDGQVTSALTLAAGISHQKNNSEGVLWGAVPAKYNDGTDIDLDVSTSTTMDWTYWDTETNEYFAELGWQINSDWRLTSTARYSDYEEASEIFYTYWNTGLDPVTGLGLQAYPGRYTDSNESLMLDFSLNGNFEAWGQEHQLRVGVSSAERDSKGYSLPALTGFEAMPAFPGWTGNEVARPVWGDASVSVDQTENLDRLYSFLLLSLTDSVKLVLGASLLDYENDGTSFGLSTDSSEDGSNPYIGLTWEIADGLNAYGSYSDIYQPQYVLNESIQPLGSAEGKSYELGVKQEIGGSAVVSLALFRSEQSNLEEFTGYGDGDGVDDTDYTDDFTYAFYRGIDVDSEGFELEVSGRLTEELGLQAGYTKLKLELADGSEARPFIPRETFKMLLTYKPSNLPALEVGLNGRWQSDIYAETSYGRVSQDAYGLLGGYVNYQVNGIFSVALNLDNITDKEYFSSTQYEQVFYAAPRSANLSVNVSF